MRKEIFKKLTYDITVTSLLKQRENLDLRETKQLYINGKVMVI